MKNIIFSPGTFHLGNKVSRNILVSTDQGIMIVNRFDFDTNGLAGHSKWLMDHGNSDTVEINYCVQSIRHVVDPVIFDVGANIGTFSIWFSKIFQSGRIYSFEPQKQIFYQLCGNISLNNLYNIDAYNIGLGSKNDYITIKEPDYFSNHDYGVFSLIEEKITTTQRDVTVEIITLDNFVKINHIKKLDLLKIDAEGMDLDVLKGATQSIENFFPVIFIEHCDNRTSNLENLKNFLKQYDYYFDVLGNNLLCQK